MLRLDQVMTKDGSLRSFLLAATAVLLAVAARGALEPVLPATPPFITLYPAIALAGLLCGPIAAGAGGLLGLLAATYLWLPPRMGLALPDLAGCVGIAAFVFASAVILAAAAFLRAQLDAAAVARHALELGLAEGGVGTWERNLATGRILASATALALHGLPPGHRETTPEDWLRDVPPEDAQTVGAAMLAAMTQGTTGSYTYRVVGPAGAARWISGRGKVIVSGGERRLLCALVDITGQVRVQEALAHERERLRLALAAAELAVWDYNMETGEATIDTQYAVTMGFDPSVGTMTRSQIGEAIHPQDRPRVAAEHDALVASGAPYRIEYRIVKPSGEIRWLCSQAARVSDHAAAAPGRMVGIIQDITDRKRRESDLRDLADTRELLIREADHRIKNSLQLVISLLTVQMRGIADPAAAGALRGAAARVGAIAASHRALQGSADLTTIDLAASLRELCAHFAALHPGVTILCRPSEPMMLDAERAIPLGLVVSELLTNALSHAFPDRDTGTVVVEATAGQAALTVRVSDDGVGMQPTIHGVGMQPAIHDAGMQPAILGVGMQPATRGTGLGSRIVNALAAQLAATIQVESPPAAGTVVSLSMPLERQDERQRQRA